MTTRPDRVSPSPSELPTTAEVDLVVHSAGQLLTLAGGPQRGPDLGRLGLIESGAVALGGGRILAAGPSEEVRRRFPAAQTLDARGRVVMPGFVDPHTHLLWMGDRSAEFEMRVRGASYMEIMAAGGGIVSTVRHTRRASAAELAEAARPRLRRMLAHGTTTAEAKTGYGLEIEAELRILEAILILDAEGPVELAPTFLGAHAVPSEYAGRAEAYAERVCVEMLPRVREWWQARAGGRRELPAGESRFHRIPSRGKGSPEARRHQGAVARAQGTSSRPARFSASLAGKMIRLAVKSK